MASVQQGKGRGGRNGGPPKPKVPVMSGAATFSDTPAISEESPSGDTSSVAIAAATAPIEIEASPEAAQTPAPAPAAADQPEPVPSAPGPVTTESLSAGSETSATPESVGAFAKERSIMATTFETTKATSEKVMGDFNARAKGAVEKSAKFAEEMSEFTKGNVEAFVASGRVAAKGAESLAQDVAETMRRNFESSTTALKSFTTVKSPTELFQLQSEYAKSYFDTLVADTSKFSESMMKLAGDIAQPLSSRYAVAAEKIKTTATTTPAL